MQQKNGDGLTPLHLAASTNDVQLLDFLIQQVNDKEKAVNTKNEEGWTPVHLAAHFSNFDSLNLLLENGGNLSKKNQVGMSPLEEMVRCDHDDLLSCVYKKQVHSSRDKIGRAHV